MPNRIKNWTHSDQHKAIMMRLVTQLVKALPAGLESQVSILSHYSQDVKNGIRKFHVAARPYESM